MALNSKLGELSVRFSADTKQFNRELSRLNTDINKFARTLKTAFAGFSIAYITTQLAQAGKAAYNFAGSIADVADQTQLSTKTIQEMRFAAISFGSSAEAADAGLNKFVAAMGSAEIKGKQWADNLKKMGVDAKATNEVKFEQFLAGLARIKSDTERAAVAVKFLGEELGMKIAGQMKYGTKALAEVRAEASAIGYVLDDDLIRRADDVGDKLTVLANVIKVRLYEALLQTLPQFEKLANFVKEHPEEIKSMGDEVVKSSKAFFDWAGSIGDANTSLGHFAEKVDRLYKAIRPLGDFIVALVEDFGAALGAADDLLGAGMAGTMSGVSKAAIAAPFHELESSIAVVQTELEKAKRELEGIPSISAEWETKAAHIATLEQQLNDLTAKRPGIWAEVTRQIRASEQALDDLFGKERSFIEGLTNALELHSNVTPVVIEDFKTQGIGASDDNTKKAISDFAVKKGWDTSAEQIVAQQNKDFFDGYKPPKLVTSNEMLAQQNTGLQTARWGGDIKPGSLSLAGAGNAAKQAEDLQKLYDKYSQLNDIVQQYRDMKADLNQLEAAGKITAEQRAEMEANYTKNLLASYQQLIDPLYQIKEQLTEIGQLEAEGIINAEQRAEYKQAILDKEAAQYKALIDPLYELNTALKELNSTYAIGALTTEEFKLAQQKLMEQLDPQTRALKEMGDEINEAFGDAFTEMIKGGKDFGDVLDDLLSKLFDIVLQAIIMKPLMDSLNSMGGAGGLMGSLMPTGWFAAKGMAFSGGGNVVPFARGGVVSKPTLFPFARGTGLMGEAGPEAIMPLARTADGKLGVRSQGGGGSVPVSIEINNKGTPTQATSASGRMTPEGLVISILTEDVSRGGRISRMMEGTYGLRRQ